MKKLTTTAIVLAAMIGGCGGENHRADAARRKAVALRPATATMRPSQENFSRPVLPELDESSDLPDYLAYAALNNAGLEAAFNQWKAALERIPQVKALPDPRFTYGYFIREVETRVGPQRQSFAIAQAFPWFGKLALRGDLAAEAANAARKRYDAAKLRLFLEVKDAWYEYYYLARAIAIANQNMQLLQHLEGVARSRYKAAAAAHPDVIRAQVELGKIDDRYRTLLDLREPLTARLNAALNRPVDLPIPMPKQIAAPPVQLTAQDLLNTLADSNPELEAMDFEIAARQRDIELAKKEYYPDFLLGVSIIDTGEAAMRDVSDSGQDPVLASVSVNIPIWREKYDAGVREARLRHQAARRQRTEMANSLSSQLKMSLYRFRDAERKINLYGSTLVPKAEEALRVTESSYRAGTGMFTDLVDAQRILLEFELDYERALANRAQSLAKLEMLIGQEIGLQGNPPPGPNVEENAGDE
ncbi:MAG: TolC family protein [Phycisphaerae bacterium]|nr:TolC family protein [Phycisphaerae bacterium]